jgi:hypothetical protein
VLDALEGYARRSDFARRWRLFLRDCALLLLPGLPPEAANWVAAADDYDAGRIDAGRLEEVRVGAWRFHDAPREARPAEQSGLRAVMYRLWPPDPPDRWHEAAGYFLEFCQEAGLPPERLTALLRARFVGLSGG